LKPGQLLDNRYWVQARDRYAGQQEISFRPEFGYIVLALWLLGDAGLGWIALADGTWGARFFFGIGALAAAAILLMSLRREGALAQSQPLGDREGCIA